MRCLFVLAVAVLAIAQAQDIGTLRAQCKETKDPLDCIKYRALDMIQQASTKDVLQVTEGIEVVRNGHAEETTEARGLVDSLEKYIESHDLRLRLSEALGGGTLSVSPRELDADRISLTLSSQHDNAVEEGKSRKKSKLKKIIIPLLVFVLLKAMTLIPLALGVLGLKAWNALQLSFFSFVSSLALAIFQLCKKVASDSSVPVAHTAWDPYHYAARNFLVGDDAQQLAYNAYTQ